MSSKWRALQHRHKYTYSAVIFPKSYIDSLHQLPSFVLELKFYVELEQIMSLTSIYSQVSQAKKLGLAFGELLGSCGDVVLVTEAARFYLEVLFFENSLQLHRTLVSSLVKARTFQDVISDCFRQLCDEYGGVNGKGKRFSVSRVALSMMSTPKLGYLVEVVEECAVMVAWDVVLGLNSVVSETSGSSRPSPTVMEQCQEALSCSYYLLQRFPPKFSDSDGSQSGLVREGSSVLETLVTVILSVLKSSAFSRDCFVAAGVSFCAALQNCLSPEKLGLVIIEGVFRRVTSSSVYGCSYDFQNAVLKVPYCGDLYSEISKFSELSRLCLIRGILTAISRTVLNTQIVMSHINLNGFDVYGEGTNCVQTMLFDCILPELCNYCENPTDSHFNFHALTVMQICLQQIKTSMSANLANLSENYDPIPEDMGTRILKIIWNNLEDPLSQTVKQVVLIFDLFLDIQSSLHWAEGTEKIKSFLKKIASDLLYLGPRCKGRYAPLTSLTKRLGAKAILDMSPDLLTRTVQAYVDDDVCCAVTSFLKCFLENLRDECWSSDGIEEGYSIFRGHCLPPFLYGLASGFTKLRSNLSTYALPVILEADVDSIFHMLAFISVGQRSEESGLVHTEISCTPIAQTVEEKLAVLVSLLKVSRLLALIEGDVDFCDDSLMPEEEGVVETKISNRNAMVCIKGIKYKVPVEWFVIALGHLDESLRVDAAELLFLNPKTSSLPSHLELSLMREAVPLNMRCCSTAFQMKWNSMFRKFFSRVKTTLERQVKQGIWQPLENCGINEVHLYKRTDEAAKARSEDLFQFMRWLSSFLFFSCYPSAPYERKIMAMDLFLIMIDTWSIIPASNSKDSPLSSEDCLYLYNIGITLPDSTLLLVGSIVDSWDKLRENSFRILLRFPTPLPGISGQGMIQKVITWAKQLVESPRVRESDAGALTLRLIFRKYVLESKWIIRASAFSINSQSELVNENENFQISNSKFPVVEYINGLIDWLCAVVEEGEKDLSEACKNSFVHGVLLTLRYTFEELDWNSDIVLSCIPNMRCLLEKLLELVLRITSLALGVVSADAYYLPEDMDEMDGNEAFLLIGDSGSSQQMVMVGCWLAMKEVSLLLGTIVRKIPLPTETSIGIFKSLNPTHDASEVTTNDVMLDLNQLETIGNHFLEVLLKMKHNGAIDKTRAGFTALCNRLLCSNDPRLCKLTDSWMEQLMERTVVKGQVVDDLLRRSAGIPAAFTALFLSEPEGTPKKLLPQALRWLIDVASRSLLDLSEAINITESSTNLNQEAASLTSHEMNGTEKISKIRDEGVVPTVHAFNVLRAAFNDANLATDTSGFTAEAIIISIRSFSSPYWEIRNSACLAYTALVRRIIGFLNVQKRESARRALTGLEFFHRYPSLHQFLLNELKVATETLGDGSSKQLVSNLANVVHPSLYPIIILLSRLKPSTITSETGDPLDPFLFMPFIRRCSTQSNLKIRVLASRALAGLISNEKLQTVVLSIASELPSIDNNHFASNSIHGTLLQLSSLLDINCRNLADLSKKNQILGELIEILLTRSWIGSPSICHCPTLNASFLRVLDHMLSIAKSCRSNKTFFAVRNLLLKLSKECLDTEASAGSSFYDPTTAEIRKQAVISYFGCVFQVSKEVTEVQMPCKLACSASDSAKIKEGEEMKNELVGFHQTLIHLMEDPSNEVRLATLKWLFQFLKSSESGDKDDNQTSSEIKLVYLWAKTELQDKLMKLLDFEKHHKCKYYILRIFFIWNKLQFEKLDDQKCANTVYVGQMDYDCVVGFWDKLVSLYKLARHAKTQEALICCLGICIKRFACLFSDNVLSDIVNNNNKVSDQIEQWSHFRKAIAYFVSVIKQHSGSAEPVNMREAAAKSMVACGLLQQAELVGSSVSNSLIPSDISSTHFKPNEAIGTYALALLEIWFTCVKLLEDEDMELRQKLAMDLQKLIASSKSRGNPKPGVAPFQVEKVIELSFEYLSSIFGHWINYFDYLLTWVLNVANNGFVSKGDDLVRRVFDKEIDNHHEENILISQLCCFQLENLPIVKSWTNKTIDKSGAINHLQEWRTRFCHQLASFADDHLMNFNNADWIGGVGNHKDAFLPIYANLLGIHVLTKCIFTVEPVTGTHLLDEIVELGEKISPFLRNPLISNLYLSVVQLHENLIDHVDHSIPKSDGHGSIWDGFDPYFLLR